MALRSAAHRPSQSTRGGKSGRALLQALGKSSSTTATQIWLGKLSNVFVLALYICKTDRQTVLIGTRTHTPIHTHPDSISSRLRLCVSHVTTTRAVALAGRWRAETLGRTRATSDRVANTTHTST